VKSECAGVIDNTRFGWLLAGGVMQLEKEGGLQEVVRKRLGT